MVLLGASRQDDIVLIQKIGEYRLRDGEAMRACNFQQDFVLNDLFVKLSQRGVGLNQNVMLLAYLDCVMLSI